MNPVAVCGGWGLAVSFAYRAGCMKAVWQGFLVPQSGFRIILPGWILVQVTPTLPLGFSEGVCYRSHQHTISCPSGSPLPRGV